jgi:hypothetical protein
MVGLKNKGKKVKSEDGDYRIYRLDRDTLSDPDRRNALQCLDRRWENYVKKEVEVLDWEPILNPTLESQQTETVENTQCQQAGGDSQQVKTPQSQSGQGFDPVPRTPTEYIYINEASWNQSDPVESQGVGQPTEAVALQPDPVTELVEAFPYCTDLETFAAVVEWYDDEVIKDAIALQDSQHRRKELESWLEALSSATEAVSRERPPISAYRQGDEVWFYHSWSEAKWLRGTIEKVGHGFVRCVSGFLGALIERSEEIAPGDWVLT